MKNSLYNNQEQWKPIEGFPGYYVSDRGRVFGKSGKILSHEIMKKGYHRVGVFKGGKIHHKMVHRLVAEAFIENPNNCPQVNHIDGNKDNNTVDNLEWCTNQYNIKHSIQIGLRNCPTYKEREELREDYKNGATVKEISKKYGVKERNVNYYTKGIRKHPLIPQGIKEEIREKYHIENCTVKQLSEKYNVCKTSVRNIIHDDGLYLP